MSDFLHSRFGRWWLGWVWLGSLLRIWQLGWAPRWYDETNTVWMASLPFWRMISATAGDVHPPLYYALLWAWGHVAGYSAIATRMPSVVLSIAALPVLLLIGRRLKLSDGVILAGTALMAVVPFEIYFAQETRMYALYQLEILLAILFMLERRWWLLGLTTAAMLWTHNIGFLFAATIYGIACIRELYRFWIWIHEISGDPHLPPIECCVLVFGDVLFPIALERLRGLVASGFLALVLYIPWLPTLIAQTKSLATWWQLPTTPGSFLEPLSAFFINGDALGPLEQVGEIIIFGLVIFAVIRAIRRSDGSAMLLAALAFAPMLLSVAIEKAGMHPTFLYRSFIGSAPLLYLLCGWAITDKTPRVLRIAAWGMLAPVLAVCLIFYYPINATYKAGVSIGFDLPAQMQAGDIVFHMNPSSVSEFREEFSDRTDLYAYVHPPMPGDRGALSSQTLTALGVRQVELEDLGWKRAWLIWGAGPSDGIDQDQEVSRLVEEYHGRLISTFGLGNAKTFTGQVWLLQR